MSARITSGRSFHRPPVSAANLPRVGSDGSGQPEADSGNHQYFHEISAAMYRKPRKWCIIKMLFYEHNGVEVYEQS